jgi:lipopolysaccharide/colanic/teichoic acid biosynthesis glycosyltransferase
MGIVAVLVWANLGRPLFFTQERPGLNGQIFRLRKFRTMTLDCDDSGRPLEDSARLTSFGRLLRSSSLDELPELANVLLGEMSLVGPRPLLVAYLGRYDSFQSRRHSVRPGVTGLTQVKGRNAIDWKRKLELDVWYVDHLSAGLDLEILSLTTWKILTREGVNQPGRATMDEFLGSPESR